MSTIVSGSNNTPDSQTTSDTFRFPKVYSYPPFFSRQPTAITRQAQLAHWSAFVQRYCRFHRVFQLTVVEALETALFYNAELKKRLSSQDAIDVIDYMASKEADERAEWLSSSKTSAWIWWRKPEEWANVIANWVDETGQKGMVLTLYEITEGETTEKLEFHGLPMQVLQKSLITLVKKGKAQVFGTDDQQGVKFF